MTAKHLQPITAEKAACLIYKTRTPNPKQVGHVRELMRRGELKQTEQRRFTTTHVAVAEYLSNEQWKKQNKQSAQGKTAGPGKEHRSHVAGDRDLTQMYRKMLSDYFLSAIVYGRDRDRSIQYQKRVFYIRLVLLLVFVGIIGWACSIGTSVVQSPEQRWKAEGAQRVQQAVGPERQVIDAWIHDNRNQGELLDLLPALPRPGGKCVRVRLRYLREDAEIRFEDSVFVIQGDEVLRVEVPGARMTTPCLPQPRLIFEAPSAAICCGKDLRPRRWYAKFTDADPGKLPVPSKSNGSH